MPRICHIDDRWAREVEGRLDHSSGSLLIVSAVNDEVVGFGTKCAFDGGVVDPARATLVCVRAKESP
jgi:hypothetical protein